MKKNRFVYFFTTILAGIFPGCFSEAPSDNAISTVETLLHDVQSREKNGIKKIKRLDYLKERVTEMREAVSDVKAVAEEAQTASIDVLTNIRIAKSSFLEWQKGFKQPEADAAEENIKKHLGEQIKQIDKITISINNAIKGGENFLGTYGVFRPSK